MKKYIITAVLSTAIFFSAFCQQTIQQNQPLTRNDYLKKSKEQKITGFVLLGAGIASIALVSNGKSDFSTTGVVVVVGGLAALSSIPLFIASGRNKRKAAAATAYLHILHTPASPLVMNVTHYMPGLSLKINW